MARLNGAVAVITGGTTGIGLATAKEYLAEGAKVVITGRTEKTLKEAEKELGPGAIVLKSDTSKPGDITQLVDKVREKFGKVDILFVNAGVAKFVPIEQVDDSFFDEQFTINVKGAYFTIQKFLPLLTQGSSVILNASVAASKGLATASVYSATKAALRSFGRTLAAELAPRGIRVNTISPGPIKTPILGKLGLPADEAQQFEANMSQQVAMKRFGQPNEIATAAVFLGSQESSYMTGAELVIDGGYAEL